MWLLCRRDGVLSSPETPRFTRQVAAEPRPASAHALGHVGPAFRLWSRCEPTMWQAGRDTGPPPAASSHFLGAVAQISVHWLFKSLPRRGRTTVAAERGRKNLQTRGAAMRRRNQLARPSPSGPGLPLRSLLLLPVPLGTCFCSCQLAEPFLGWGAPPWTGAASRARGWLGDRMVLVSGSDESASVPHVLSVYPSSL